MHFVQSGFDVPVQPFSASLQFITATGRGHYLADDSLAAPAGVVEAFDEECEELPPD